eukprot:3636469-Rhodomonas_salina.1
MLAPSRSMAPPTDSAAPPTETQAPPSTAAPLQQALAPVFAQPSAPETDPEKILQHCNKIIEDLRMVRAMPSRPDTSGGWGCVIP